MGHYEEDDKLWQPHRISPKEQAAIDQKNEEALKQFVEKHKLQATEVRVVDPVSGGEKGSKLAAFSLIPPEATWALAEHYGRGMKKYAARNWERGYKWTLSVDALQRHLHQWMMGESYDEETGSHHLIAVAWHAIALFVFEVRNLGTDDVRTKK